jgi:hypothetical protein
MRNIAIVTAVALTAIWTLPSASAQANTFTVDCNRGQKLANALRQGDFRKPLVINVRGTCREFVTIARDNVTLRGDPAAELVAGGHPRESHLDGRLVRRTQQPGVLVDHQQLRDSGYAQRRLSWIRR